MNRQITIRHLFAALAWLGLALAPFAPPASAMAVSTAMAAAQVETTMDMPEGMPCCPDQPAKPDCMKDCPFMAVCASTVLMIAKGAALTIPTAVAAIIAAHDDTELSGLSQPPPARPPNP